MAVYIDSANIEACGDLWCHMVADSMTELHAFAASLPPKTCRFHRMSRHPHYDLRTAAKNLVMEMGAIEVTQRRIVLVTRELRKSALLAVKARVQQMALF